MQTYAAQRHFPKGVALRVKKVRVAGSDPNFAAAVVSLTGGPYGRGNTAVVVAMQVDGSWSLVAGPGEYPCGHPRPTAKVIKDLVCSVTPG